MYAPCCTGDDDRLLCSNDGGPSCCFPKYILLKKYARKTARVRQQGAPLRFSLSLYGTSARSEGADQPQASPCTRRTTRLQLIVVQCMWHVESRALGCCPNPQT